MTMTMTMTNYAGPKNAYSCFNLWRASLDKIFLIINCFSVTKRKVIEANTNDLNTWKGAPGQRESSAVEPPSDCQPKVENL
jgi:hypothetical protein